MIFLEYYFLYTVNFQAGVFKNIQNAQTHKIHSLDSKNTTMLLRKAPVHHRWIKTGFYFFNEIFNPWLGT